MSNVIGKLVHTSLYKTSDSMFTNLGFMESPEGCVGKEHSLSFALDFPLLKGGEVGRSLQFICMSVTCVRGIA